MLPKVNFTKNRYLLAVAALVIVFGIAIRMFYIAYQYTTIDDYGPVLAIEDHLSNQPPQDPTLKNLIYQFHQNFFKVSYSFTYAPLQYLLHHKFINPKTDYELKKIYNRIPSFLFYLLTISILWITLSKQTVLNLAQKVFILSTYSLSSQSIFYSAHGSNYSAAQLATVLMLNLLLKENSKKLKSYILNIFIITIAISLSYQAIILVAGYFSALLYLRKDKLQLIKEGVIALSFVFIISLPTIFLPLASYISNGNSLNWNVGLSNEFVIIQATNLQDRLIEFMELLIKTPIIIDSLINPTQNPSSVLGSIATVFFIIGLTIAFQSKNEFDKRIFFFSSLIIIFQLALVFLGKLSFSPTRHSLFLLPIVSIILAYGLAPLLKLEIANLLVPISFVIILYTSTQGHLEIAAARNDYSSEVPKVIEDFIKKNKLRNCEVFTILPRRFENTSNQHTKFFNLNFNISLRDILAILDEKSECTFFVSQRSLLNVPLIRFLQIKGVDSFGFKSTAPNGPNVINFYFLPTDLFRRNTSKTAAVEHLYLRELR